ncbi:hypothetical protein FNH09_41500 [Streptomyces adustus]|uniref:DUF3558 domain-containing protein n=1 Tax=Streptomyces adustus TaxID=1609272 RepID=A0A5N8VQA0_9ACTN|nr:hypothetical protein [Streptomyces adustus]MPY37457.1 hypothetical protein [Streptomyces adustus]
MPAPRGTSVAALLGGLLLLTACQSGSDTGASGSSGPSAPQASATTATASGAPAAGAPSDSAAPTAPAVSAPKQSTAPAVPAKATAPAFAGCRNLAVSAEVKSAVTTAYRRTVPVLVHVAPVPGQFFYGQCGSVRYAATRFQPTAGATEAELVNLQDEGTATKYFRAAAGGGWVYVATDGFPRSAHGCGDIPEIPNALAKAWHNCPDGH